MKFPWPLLFASIFILIHANPALSQQEMKSAQPPIGSFNASPIDSETLKQIRQDAENGHPKAQMQLGLIYRLGNGVPRDYVEATKWFRRAADQAFAAAQVQLGLMYLRGDGVPQDNAEAVKWIRTAAEQGFAAAQYQLGMMYRLGEGVPQDDVAAEEWTSKAAEQGFPQVQPGELEPTKRVGPFEIPRDAEMLNRIREFAEQGHVAAQNTVGMAYLQGKIVPQDYAEAAKWLRQAAEKGVTAAQFNLGFMYLQGNGVAQDFGEAVKWFRDAAKRDDISSQCMLGAIYGDENSKAKDYVQAHMWLNLCATSGKGERQQTAAKFRDDIAGKMTPQQLQEAERLEKEWVSRYLQRPVDGVYIAGRGVVAPVVQVNPMPAYTDRAREARVSGILLIECIVRKTGNVDSCKILRGLGYGLDESAINTIETQWRFQPGALQGNPVDVKASFQVTFKIK